MVKTIYWEFGGHHNPRFKPWVKGDVLQYQNRFNGLVIFEETKNHHHATFIH